MNKNKDRESTAKEEQEAQRQETERRAQEAAEKVQPASDAHPNTASGSEASKPPADPSGNL